MNNKSQGELDSWFETLNANIVEQLYRLLMTADISFSLSLVDQLAWTSFHKVKFLNCSCTKIILNWYKFNTYKLDAWC